MAQAEHVQHSEKMWMFHHHGVTVYALRPHELSQHDFDDSKVIAGACLPCSINVCFYFDYNPEMPPELEGLWAKVNVDHAWALEYPDWTRRNPGEDVFAWFERCRSHHEKWQPSRSGWPTDEQFHEFCKCQMVAAKNQILYHEWVHTVVNHGFRSTDEALTKLAPHIQELKRFHVVAKFEEHTRFWAYCKIENALESAIKCWLYASESWGINPKPFMTAVWSVEEVAVAITYNPNTNALMLTDSHPYNSECGASVTYGMGSNIMGLIDHAFFTTFRTENLNSRGERIRGKLFQQMIELVLSESMAERYKSHETLLPLEDIFKLFDLPDPETETVR